MRKIPLRAGVLLVALIGTLFVVPTLPASADAIPPTQYTAVSLSDMDGSNHLLSQPDGGVTLGCSGGTTGTKRISAAGTVAQNIPNVDPYPGTCARTSAVGGDGTLFTAATNANGWPRIQAIKNGVAQWTYVYSCNAVTLGMAVGLNGNLYVLNWCSGQNSVIGFEPNAAPGNTTPTTVLNVNVSSAAMDGGIAAYGSGLVLRLTNGVQYVTYTGTVGTPITVTGILSGTYQEYQDATLSGRMVVSVRGSSTAVQFCGNDDWTVGGIYAYEPSGSMWSGYNSLPACSHVYEIRPTPGGGAVVHYDSPQGGIPGNPRVHKLLALDGSGGHMWTVDLMPSIVNLTYMVVNYAVDGNGNVAVQRWVNYQVSGSGYPAVQLLVLSGFSGGAVGTYELMGDPTGNGTGYKPYGQFNGVSISKGTWNVPAIYCTTWQNCDNGTAKLYAFTVPGLQMDYPRGDIILPSAGRFLDYVALGDSFSSGEGVPSFDASTNTSGPPQNRCHRSSTGAYARLLSATPSLNLNLTAFVACSGATTTQITGTWPTNVDPLVNTDELAQVAALSTSTDLVTITIGGNDIGFSDFAKSCVGNNGLPPQPPGGCDTTGAYPTILSQIHHNLPSRLNATLKGIENEIGANTKVLVIGYPILIPDSSINTLPNCPYLDAGEKDAARDVITRLNAALQTAVIAANNVQQVHRFEYVDPNYNGSPFKGHELCMAGGYFHGVQTPVEYSLHPNANGQDAYRQVVLHHLG